MHVSQRNELAESWRRSLESGHLDVMIWRDGPLSILLRRHAIQICAGHAMDVVLPLEEVSVSLSPGDTRLDWDTGALDIDVPTAEGLAAFGLRAVQVEDNTGLDFNLMSA